MTEFRNTALHAAATAGNLEAAARLIARGADLEAVGKGGWTPLTVAVYKGHLRVVELLLKAGAQVPQAALDFAAEYGYAEIGELLRRDDLDAESSGPNRMT